jgi:glutamine amidotransferase
VSQVIVLDYGFGNVRSVMRAVEKNGYSVELSNDFNKCLEVPGLIVPGVGAFAACMDGLNKVRADEIIDKRLVANKPVLGICVGMQVMFSQGVEHSVTTAGLAQWAGVVEELAAPVLPHMGFNTVSVAEKSLMFAEIENEQFYFLHSFATKDLKFDDSSILVKPLVHKTVYFESFVSAIEDGPLWATQFHPEKSGPAGLKLINNWLARLDA